MTFNEWYKKLPCSEQEALNIAIQKMLEEQHAPTLQKTHVTQPKKIPETKERKNVYNL